MIRLLLVLVLLLVAPSALFAEEADTPKRSSVALPGQSAYIGEGLSLGLAVGVFNPIEDCDCMGSWQGQLEFFYKKWVSGSFEVRFFGGDLDSDVMLMFQRYRINVRLHQPFERLSLFEGLFLGLENLSIAEFKSQVQGEESSHRHRWWNGHESEDADSVDKDDHCREYFAMDGFSVGLAVGGGYNVSRYFALTSMVQAEYNFSDRVLLSVVPGVAFNLWQAWAWAKQALRSTWISFEVGGQRYVSGGVKGWSNTFFLGIQFGA